MIVTCLTCFATTAVQHETPSFSEPQYIKFCPICGSRDTKVRQNMDEEGWFVISKDLGLPVEALKKLYTLWNPNEGDNKNFCNWIRERQHANARQT